MRKKEKKLQIDLDMEMDDASELVSHKVIKKGSKQKKRKKRGFIYRMSILFLLSITAVCVWCIYCYCILIFQKDDRPLQHADTGIILGAALWNNTPSPALRERLEESIRLYEQDLVDYLILSGGKNPASTGLTEAEGMRNYLIDAGIPEDKLLLEMKSTDTYENLLFSSQIMHEKELDSAIIISHSYHGLRAADIAGYLGMKDVQIAGVKTKVLNEAYHYTREVLAYTKWQLNKLIKPIGINI